jgi:hypothetical protein
MGFDSAALTTLGAIFNLNHHSSYVNIGHWFQMSVSNLIVIIVMIVVFFAAILLPFPHGRRS